MIQEKINKCIHQIKNTKLKKDGYNSFSKYSYFTPEQVDRLVYEATSSYNVFVKFDLKRNEFGIIGVLSLVDLEDNSETIYEMATDIPEIKATNIAQQLGGAMTYTKRYLLMNAFGIVDNNLDFDTEKEPTSKEVDNKPWMKKEDINKIVVSAKEKGLKAADLRQYYKISKDIFSQLEQLL